MSKSEKALVVFIGAVVIGAVAQQVARQQAALLGLSALEVALFGAAVGAAVRRQTA